MTEYLETWRKALEERGMRISRTKTQFMDFNFGQDNGQEREPVKILGEELQRVHGGMATEITQSECSMEKLEEMQWSVV